VDVTVMCGRLLQASGRDRATPVNTFTRLGLGLQVDMTNRSESGLTVQTGVT